MALLGGLYALAAYGTWGLSPLFWRQLEAIPPLEIIGHRVLWGMLLFFLLLSWRGRRGELAVALRRPRTLGTFALTALLLGINWFLFIYSVYIDRVVEASLGYFINPLLNVVLGFVFLRERPRPVQWLAVLLTAAGVVRLATTGTGAIEGVPWIGLTLAATFGFYGLVRKTAKADALLGSNLETLWMLPPALGYLAWLTASGQDAWNQAPASTLVWVPLTGFMTAFPLLCFSNAARRLPLTTLGFFQYIAPTCQFLLAVFAFGEPFTRAELVGFVLIWIALAVFAVESSMIRRVRTRPRGKKGAPWPH
jgi:chloramphenicol-sensitive protein RarD